MGINIKVTSVLVFVSYTLRKHVNSKQRIQWSMVTSLKVTDTLACFHTHQSPYTIRHLSHTRNTSLKVDQIMLVGVGRGGGGRQSIHFHITRLRSEVQPLPFHIPCLISLPKRYPFDIHNAPKNCNSFLFLKDKANANANARNLCSVCATLILVFKWAVP